MEEEKRPVILVVDDEPLVLMDMVNTLEQAGYQVRQARFGAEAMHVIASHSPPIAALVTDVEMPGEMDGCGLAWRVAATSSRIALIVMSGKGAIDVGCLHPIRYFCPNRWIERNSSIQCARVFAESEVEQ